MSLHHLLMINHLLLQKKFFIKIKENNLTPGQPKVLEYLSTHDGAIQKEIASACHIEPASITSVLSGMEKAGLVKKQTDPLSKRNVNVFITPQGREKWHEIEPVFHQIDDAALSGFSKEEAEQLNCFLNKIYENLKGCI